jgi:hypothetical protein
VIDEANRLVKRWRKRLDIGPRWTVNVIVHEDTWPDDHAGEVAFVTVAHGYKDVDLHLNKPLILETRANLNETIVHELVHVVLWPLWVVYRDTVGSFSEEGARDMNESITEQVTHGLIAAEKGR